MKKNILFKLHSFVDVITNSSTELFVGETTNSIAVIKEILRDYFDVYYKHNPDSEYDGTVESICIVEMIDKSNVSKWVTSITNYGSLYWLDLKGTKPEYGDFRNEGKCDWEAYHKAEEDWVEENREVFEKGLLGYIVIEGNGDNSIPYELYDLVERVFTGHSERIHQG